MEMYNGLQVPPIPDKFETQKEIEDYVDALNTFLDQLLNKTSQYYYRPQQMTTTQIAALNKPLQGTLMYNTTTNKLEFFDGSVWRIITST